MHILGYYIDGDLDELKKLCNRVSELRKARLYEHVSKLEKEYNLQFDELDLMNLTKKYSTLGRPHIGKLLIKYGYASSMEEAFKKYLFNVHSSIFYRMDAKLVIDAIHKAGGIAILAHPKKIEDKYNIDIVLSGSDGVYYRTDAMRDNAVSAQPQISYPHQAAPDTYYKTIPNPTGVVYSSLGSSGVLSEERHRINNVDFPESGYNTNPKYPMFSAIEIYGDTLYLTSYTLSGNRAKKIDSVSIKKGNVATADVDYDGKLTAADARLILRATARLELFTADQLKLADVTGDGKISAADARAALRKAAGLE
jgi:hypothetical protein